VWCKGIVTDAGVTRLRIKASTPVHSAPRGWGRLPRLKSRSRAPAYSAELLPASDIWTRCSLCQCRRPLSKHVNASILTPGRDLRQSNSTLILLRDPRKVRHLGASILAQLADQPRSFRPANLLRPTVVATQASMDSCTHAVSRRPYKRYFALSQSSEDQWGSMKRFVADGCAQNVHRSGASQYIRMLAVVCKTQC